MPSTLAHLTRLLAAGLALAGTATAEPVALAVRPDAVRPLAEGPLLAVARLELGGEPRIGGLSAIVYLQAPERLLLATDRGWLLATTPRFAPDGALVGLDDGELHRLRLPPGWHRDVEALAVDGGDLVATTEGSERQPPRILRFAGPAAAPGRVLGDRALGEFGLRPNKGMEALVDLPGGGWLALGETPAADGTVLALAKDGRTWRYVAAVDHAPTGADRVDDRLFVVERALSLVGGWQARIACLPVGDLASAAPLRPRTLARLGIDHGIDNMEGIAVWARGEDLEMLLVSDDNFSLLQRSLLLHYRWPGGASGGCGPKADDDSVR